MCGKMAEQGERGSAAVYAEPGAGAGASVPLTFTPFYSSVLILSARTHCTVRQPDIYANILGKAERISAATQSKRCNSQKPSSVSHIRMYPRKWRSRFPLLPLRDTPS